MRQLRRWWLGLPLITLALTAVAVAITVRTGPLWPFGSAEREARRPEAEARPDREEPPRPAQERFTFRAVRDGERVALRGFVSREGTRTALAEQARQAVPNAVVSDELKATDKAPLRLDEGAAFAVGQLARLPSGTIMVDGDAISLVGQAPDISTYNALAGAQARPDGFRVDIAGLIPPLVRPYTWSATSSEAAVALAGHVPSEAARQTVGGMAREAFPDKHLVDRLQPASGLPRDVDFDATVRFALTELAKLQGGTAELVDGTLNLRGDVTDRETLADVRAALQSRLPAGLQPGSVAIKFVNPSPYTFRAKRESGALTLTGYYPDPDTRAAIHQLVRQRFFHEQVVDRLRAGDGAPQNYLAGVSFGLEHLARLASGELAVSGTALRLSGESLYEQTAEQMARTVPSMPLRGWTGRAEVRVRPSEKADAAGLSSPQP